MSTDTSHEYEVLEGRLDRLDHQSRLRRVVVAAVAVAAVVLSVVAAVALRGATTATPPPVSNPSSAPRYTTVAMSPQVSLVLPTAIAQARSVRSSEGGGSSATWETAECSTSDCPESVALFGIVDISRVKPLSGTSMRPITSGDAYLAYLADAQSQGVVKLSDAAPITVGGFAGTIMTVRELLSAEDGLGCGRTSRDCFRFDAGMLDRVVVLKTTGSALTLWIGAPLENPGFPTLRAQFEQMLPTVTFGPVPSPGTS